MSITKDILKLIRIEQWYKNFLIFIPLVFSLNFFNIRLLFITFLGFISLSLISSSYYIINDLKDIQKDKHHPEKKNRPLASGRLSRTTGILILILFLINSITLSYYLSPSFLVVVLVLFLSSQIYSFFLREVAFLDIIAISINFIIRTVSGVFLTNIPISYYLWLCAFFLSIFLVSGKRISETNLKDLSKYRSSLKKEYKQTLTLMATISVAAVIIFFSVFSINIFNPYLLITLPIAFYMILLYFNGVYHHPEKIRNPEKFIFDKKILISLILWVILLLITLYLPRII